LLLAFDLAVRPSLSEPRLFLFLHRLMSEKTECDQRHTPALFAVLSASESHIIVIDGIDRAAPCCELE
jgi:hypothetical protein